MGIAQFEQLIYFTLSLVPLTLCISTSRKLKVLGIDIGIGIFNTFQMEKGIEVLGIQ